MACALTSDYEVVVAFSGQPNADNDSLDAVRGIIACTLISVLVFWLPLAFALTW